ncbi:L,D-transpeptidase [Chloroflexota bacterium]
MLKSLRIALLPLLLIVVGTLFIATPALANVSACASLSTELPASPECEAEITENPAPNVEALTPDYGALARYTFMRLVNGDDEAMPIVIYDGPGGAEVATMDPGFHFVTILSVADDWVEINVDQWVRAVDVQAQQASTFAGVRIHEALKYPLAWILVNTYTAEYPGGPQVIDSDRLHFRYDTVNVYATVELEGHNWYLIAPGEWVYHTWVGLAQAIPQPEGVSGHWVAVDLYEQTLVAYEDDQVVFATLVSSGLAGWDTNEGLFDVWARFESDHMSGAEGADDFYYLENVPYTMYFDGDISLHGTYWHNGFGYRHSHGCVNLSISDARWLFDWTNAEDFKEAPVVVFSSNQY